MNPFDAIENAILLAHPGADFVLFGGVPARTEHALNGAVVIRVPEPQPHWLLVSQGFTELWDKRSSDPRTSGMGFELVCRVPARGDEHDFGWVLHWMQAVADKLSMNGANLDAGHTMDMTEPGDPAKVCALAFIPDIELEPTSSDNGSFQFLQMVGLRPRELEAARAWNTHAFVSLLQERDPLCVLDTRARDHFDDDDFRTRVEEGTQLNGSALGVLTGVPATWRAMEHDLHLHLQPGAVEPLVAAVTNRLAQGAMMVFHGTPDDPDHVIVLRPEAGDSTVEVRDGKQGAVLRLDPAAQGELLTLLSAPQRVPVDGVRLGAANLRVFVDAPRQLSLWARLASWARR